MLTTPSLKIPIRPFDATKDYEFIFYINGGSQILRSNLVISDAITGLEVYNKTQESFAYKHSVIGGTLINGKQYTVKVRTGGIEGKWSGFSDTELFDCLSQANITVTNIDYENQNRVYNQTVLFEATYTQAELEVLQNYRFILYDKNKDMIRSFPEQFYSGTGSITQEVTGLENGELYYIQVKTESQKGLLSDTSLIWLRPFYITPRLSAVITPTNLKEQGSIKLSSNIIQIIGKLYDNLGSEIEPSSVDYIDGELIDLTRQDYSRLEFKDGFKIMQNNFTFKLWCKNIAENEIFLRLDSDNEHGYIDLVKKGSNIHAYKVKVLKKGTVEEKKIIAHFISNDFNFVANVNQMIHIRQVDNLLDVVVMAY